MVQVVLMAQGEDIDDATASKLISQATVRRDVVIRLIQAMKDRGHREYSGYNMAQVREHAEAHLVPNIAGMTPAIPKRGFCDPQQEAKCRQAPPRQSVITS